VGASWAPYFVFFDGALGVRIFFCISGFLITYLLLMKARGIRIPEEAPRRTENVARILYVTDGISPWVVGGMQVVARRHIAWLGDAGHDVLAVASRGVIPERADLPARIVFVPWPAGSTFQKLNPWNYAWELQRFSVLVTKLADEFRPDLIYTEGPLVDEYLARNHHERVPVIFHPHGLEMFQGTGSSVLDARMRPLRGIVRRHALGAQVVLSQGGRLDDIVSGPLGVDEAARFTLPNCPPIDFPPAVGPRSIQKGRFLFIGRNEVRKGLPLLLDAVQIVDGATLDVIGATKNGLRPQPRVTFHGEIRERAAIRAQFDRADFLVVPSYAEGMPTVILEAFSAGLPVIGTDVGAVAELVHHKGSGLLTPRGDGRALADADSVCSLSGRLSADVSDRAPPRARNLLPRACPQRASPDSGPADFVGQCGPGARYGGYSMTDAARLYYLDDIPTPIELGVQRLVAKRRPGPFNSSWRFAQVVSPGGRGTSISQALTMKSYKAGSGVRPGSSNLFCFKCSALEIGCSPS
jgi:glycosyltransferase involved in cell wall biosynthesis